MRIFLSYRRRDTQHAAGRLADRLNRRFGSDNVFVDVTSLPPGVDYHDYITQAIEQCDVLLAIIGAEWINARTAAGTRRLDEADDLMRLEIAAGLERGIPVVPVLVDDASKPRADQLPPELAALASRQAVRISHASFDVDSDRLIASLTKRRKSRRSVLIAAAIGAITVAATAAVVISPPHIPSATSRTLSPPASSAVKPVSWQNFTYKLTCDGIADSGFADQNGIIATLHNGLAVAKGENGIQGEYDVKFRVAVSGDITGDGQPETIVLLSCSPKGANYFVDEVQVFGPSNKLMGELPSPHTLQGEAVLAPEYVPAELRVEGGNVVAGMLFYAVGASHADGATEAHTITWHWTGSLFEKVNTS